MKAETDSIAIAEIQRSFGIKLRGFPWFLSMYFSCLLKGSSIVFHIFSMGGLPFSIHFPIFSYFFLAGWCFPLLFQNQPQCWETQCLPADALHLFGKHQLASPVAAKNLEAEPLEIPAA